MQKRVDRASRLVRIGAFIAMLELGIFVAGYLVYWILYRPGDLDFGSQWAAAYIGVHNGWNHLYDQSLIHPIEAANHLDGPAPFQHPPPDAWLAVPFLLLPLREAGQMWQALALAALVASALLMSPPTRWGRAFTFLSIAGFQPVLIALGYGTMSPFVLLLLVATLVAMRRGAPWWAGFWLGLTVVKPQLTLLTVPVLIAAGHWKTALGAIAVMASLALASVAVIGVAGTRDYVTFLTSTSAINHQMPLTIKSVVGAGVSTAVATLVVAAVAAVVAFRMRLRPEATIVLGVLASLIVAEHLNVGDLVLWLLPVWLVFSEGRPAWLRVVAGVTWTSGWLAIGLPIACVISEASLAVAFIAAERVRAPEATALPRSSVSPVPSAPGP